LKEFSNSSNIKYKNILGKVITRWLSLSLTIITIIEIYPALPNLTVESLE